MTQSNPKLPFQIEDIIGWHDGPIEFTALRDVDSQYVLELYCLTGERKIGTGEFEQDFIIRPIGIPTYAAYLDAEISMRDIYALASVVHIAVNRFNSDKSTLEILKTIPGSEIPNDLLAEQGHFLDPKISFEWGSGEKSGTQIKVEKHRELRRAVEKFDSEMAARAKKALEENDADFFRNAAAFKRI